VSHKVRIYKEYHSVCPLVGIGTLPTAPTPSLASECAPPPRTGMGGGGLAHSPAGEGLGEFQFRRLEKKLSTLLTLCCVQPVQPSAEQKISLSDYQEILDHLAQMKVQYV
jgi:hypothetical protein